jgi:hypothetical protein
VVRQQGRCGQTGLRRLLQPTGMSSASTPRVNISSSLCRHNLTPIPAVLFFAARCQPWQVLRLR